MDKERLRKLKELEKIGIKPFEETKYERTHLASEILENYSKLENKEVRISGRIMSLRKHGKISFAHIQDSSGKIQLYMKFDEMKMYKEFLEKNLLDIGDIVGVKGIVTKTKRDEISILVKELKLLAKALNPLPEKWHGLKDVELRYRQRYLDLIMNPKVKEIFVIRSKVISAMREFLEKNGYIEVQTPILQPIYGGALAKPFKTFYNALNTTVYLRISNELYLKRLLIGGYEKIYEICVDFRNEGLDSMHNPEFWQMETMWAYANYEDNMKFAEKMISYIAKRIFGTTKIIYQGYEIDLKPPWKRMSLLDAIKKYTGEDLSDFNVEHAKEVAKKLGVKTESKIFGKIVEDIFDEKVLPNLIQPTFITDYPADISPLAKRKKDNPNLTERFEAFVAGSIEFMNSYSELNDPIQQKKVFKEMAKLREKLGVEVHEMDEDYIKALEYAMPPASGLGVGIDRLVMLFANKKSIKEVLLFPHLRPKEK